MATHHQEKALRASMKRQLVVVAVLFAIALGIISFFTRQQPTLSPEVKFTDLSASGLQIVPASCPSNPNYTNQCIAPPSAPPCNPNIQFNCSEQDCALSASTYTTTGSQPVTLYWDYYAGPQANNVTISPAPGLVYGGGSPTLVSGTVTVTPTVTTEYSLTDTDQQTSSQDCNATITVVPVTSPDCSVSFGQNPIAYGSNTSLTWSSSNADDVYINNVGYVAASGSTTVGPLATTDYSCNAGNSTGTTTSPAVLDVTPPATPTVTITASSTTVTLGQPINLTATFTPGVSSVPTVIYLTSGSSWQVPNNWNSASNTIEVIGGGGGGAAGSYSNGPGGGGGGGAYAERSNVPLTPGSSIPIQIGAAGTGGTGSGGAGTQGTGTWFNNTSLTSTTSVYAKAGLGGALGSGGAGGSAANSNGTLTFNGGNGGNQGSGAGGLGGGAAAGPHGAGGNGASNVASFGGSGGGGADAGAAGGLPSASNWDTAGVGGNNASGSGGGSAGTDSAAAGTGTSGGGGGGGAGGYSANTNGAVGAAGGTGTEWASSHGSGGGGGGGGGANGSFAGAVGGSGGLYGAGGGGGGYTSVGPVGPGGAGAPGIMVITYYPVADPITGTDIDYPVTHGLSATTSPASKSVTYYATTTGAFTFYGVATTQDFSDWTAYASTTVTVLAGPQCLLSVSPSSISKGQSSTLTWGSWNATGLSINHGIGSVTPDATSSTSISPASTTTYTATVNSGGIATSSCAVTLPVSCTASYSCSGSMIQYTDSSCNVTNITSCVSPTFCSTGSSICLYPPIIVNNELQAVPDIVHSGDTTTISWNVTNAQSCSVTGSNGDSWFGLSGSHTSKPIAGQTAYSLVCSAPGDATTTETEVVNLTPVFLEN